MLRPSWLSRRRDRPAPALDLGAGDSASPTTGAGGPAAALAAIVAIWLAVAIWRIAIDVVVPWDSKNQFYVFFRFLASAIHAGATPFWNPYHYGGHPSIADPQSLIFAPAFLAWALIDAAPSMRTFDLLVYGHLLIGATAIAVYGRRAGWPSSASVLAAALFMFGACASGRLQHTGDIIVYGLFPAALLLLQVALQRRSIPVAAAFAVVTAALALGRNQVALLMCFVLAAFSAAEIVGGERPWRYLASRAAVLSTMSVLGFVLVAAPVLLTLQFAGLSNRPSITLSSAFESSLYPPTLAMLAVPDIFGSHDAVKWVPNGDTVPGLTGMDDSFGYMFIGSAAVLVLMWLGVAGGGAWRRGRRLLSAVAVLSVLYMMGRYTPLFALAFDYVPGVGYFRRPIDANFVFLAVLALLIGHLLADYVREGLPRLRPWPLALTAAGSAAVIASALIYSSRTDHGTAAVIELMRTAPVPVVAALILARAAGAAGRRRAAAAVAAIAIAELLWWNAASPINAVPRQAYAVLERPAGEEAAALAALERALAERHRAGQYPRVEVLGTTDAFQNLAVVRGWEAINGYNPLRIGIYDRLVAPGEVTARPEERTFSKSFSSYDCFLARALGLEFLVLGEPIERMPPTARRPAADLIHRGGGVWIYRLHHPWPRISFGARFQVADADAAGEPINLSPDPAPIDDAAPPQSPGRPASPAFKGSARIVSWRPDRIEIEATSPLGGKLVVHSTYYPGWIAEIDGKPARIVRADLLFSGLEVPAGRRRVVFRYAPLALHNLADALMVALHRAGR